MELLDSVERVRLWDGSAVTIRPTTARDEPALRALLANLSPQTRRLRFFDRAADVDKAAHWYTGTDAHRYGLIAHDGLDVTVGHAAYVRLGDTHAEVAVEVSDHLHGRGLGTILIERLAEFAKRQGITDFMTDVLRENSEMPRVSREALDAGMKPPEDTDTMGFPTSM